MTMAGATNIIPPEWPVALIGAGSVGSALVRRLAAAGFPIRAVISGHQASARALADRIEAPVAGTEPTVIPEEVRLVLCCVPDRELSSLAESLYLLPRNWAESVILHTSGAQTTDILAPLAARGATTLSFHPLQAFTRLSGPASFSDIYFGLEGNDGAVSFGRALAAAVGSKAVIIPAAARARYHLAASVASNFFVTLMGLAGEILGTAGIDHQTAAAMLRPLVEGTWRNLANQLPEEALTGPIARGDVETIVSHLDALGTELPHLRPLYVALATETVRVAVRGGKLRPNEARVLLDTLHGALFPDEEPLQ